MLGSPLRYPGGKAKLYDYFCSLISRNKLFDRTYCEPYAGGAGLALRLLSSGFVTRIALNDIDPSIFSFWRVALSRSEELCNLIESVPVTIEEWLRQKAIWQTQDASDELALGFATFFLNRTNRSGIIDGAGPIGGYAQDGPWRLDVRLNKQQLVSQLRAIATFKRQISVSNLVRIRRRPHDWRARVGAAGSMMALREGQAAC
jgi:DNA adenine methylase